MDHIKKKAKKYPKLILFSGTNRQDPAVELKNASKPFYDQYDAYEGIDYLFSQRFLVDLKKELSGSLSPSTEVTLDRTLLGAIFNISTPDDEEGPLCNTTLGEELALDTPFNELLKSYDKCKNESKFNSKQLKKLLTEGGEALFRKYLCPFDKTKISLLYMQMHKVASENPDKQIDFEFIDDTENILEALAIFFSLNRSVMPKNITLQLLCYNPLAIDKVLEYSTPIKGTGLIDEQYRQTLRSMFELAQKDLPEDTKETALKEAIAEGLKPFSQENFLTYYNKVNDAHALRTQSGKNVAARMTQTKGKTTSSNIKFFPIKEQAAAEKAGDVTHQHISNVSQSKQKLDLTPKKRTSF